MENKLRLTKELYREEEINNARDAFQGLVTIGLTQESGYYVCSFQKSKYPLEETIKEFENYIIDLMNSERKID